MVFINKLNRALGPFLLRNGVRVRSALGTRDSPFLDIVTGIQWAQTLISIEVDHDAREYIQEQRPTPMDKWVDQTFDKVAGKNELEQKRKTMTPSQLRVVALEDYLRPALLPNETWSDVGPWRFHKRLLKWVRAEFLKAKHGLDVQGALLYHDPALKQSPQLERPQRGGILASLSASDTAKAKGAPLPSAALVEKAFGMINWSPKKSNKAVRQKMQQLCANLGGRVIALRGGGVLVSDIPSDAPLQGVPLEYVLELAGGHVAFCGAFNALCEERNIYQLWTREYVDKLAIYLLERANHHDHSLGETVIIDMGAGDGLLAEQLQLTMSKDIRANAARRKSPTHVKVPTIISVDNGSWRIRPRATVEKLSVEEALAKYAPQGSNCSSDMQARPQQTIVLCSWMPMGVDWTALFRQYQVDEYILIGECDDGTCGDNWSTWGNEHYTSDDVVEQDLLEAFEESSSDDGNQDSNVEDDANTLTSTPPPYRVDGYKRIDKSSWAPFQFSRFDSSISKTGKTVVFRLEKEKLTID
jgi:hypothetical protein